MVREAIFKQGYNSPQNPQVFLQLIFILFSYAGDLQYCRMLAQSARLSLHTGSAAEEKRALKANGPCQPHPIALSPYLSTIRPCTVFRPVTVWADNI